MQTAKLTRDKVMRMPDGTIMLGMKDYKPLEPPKGKFRAPSASAISGQQMKGTKVVKG